MAVVKASVPVAKTFPAVSRSATQWCVGVEAPVLPMNILTWLIATPAGRTKPPISLKVPDATAAVVTHGTGDARENGTAMQFGVTAHSRS